MSPLLYVDVCQFLFCFCSLCIYHNMLAECLYGLPCKRNKAIKRITLASIFARQSIQSWPVCTERERKHTYRTSEKVCDKAQLYEYKQQDQTQTDKIYLIFSISKDVKDSNITWQSSVKPISLQTAPIQVKITIVYLLRWT